MKYETVVKIATVINTHGSFFANFLSKNKIVIDHSAIASVVKFVQVIAFCIVPHTISYWCSHFQADTQNILFN